MRSSPPTTSPTRPSARPSRRPRSSPGSRRTTRRPCRSSARRTSSPATPTSIPWPTCGRRAREDRPDGARAGAQAGDLTAAGFLVTSIGATALGNSKGLFAYHRSTNANYTLTVRTKDGTGRAGPAPSITTRSRSTSRAVSRHAIEKARLSRNPVAIEPGRYTVDHRAAGRRRPLPADRLLRRRPLHRRGTLPVREAGRRQQDRREDHGRARRHLRRPLRPDGPRPALRRRRTPPRPAGVHRERRAQDAVLLALLGAEEGRAADRRPDVVPDDVRRRHHRRPREVHPAGRPRHPPLVPPRSGSRAPSSTRASRATARSSSRTARSPRRSRTSASTTRRCSC